jgi:hypothetical protein
LVVASFARNREGTIKRSETTKATASILFISRLLLALFKHPHDDEAYQCIHSHQIPLV